MSRDERKAYREGQAAFNEGKGYNANPYLFSQQRTLHDAWDTGYNDELDRAI